MRELFFRTRRRGRLRGMRFLAEERDSGFSLAERIGIIAVAYRLQTIRTHVRIHATRRMRRTCDGGDGDGGGRSTRGRIRAPRARCIGSSLSLTQFKPHPP